jgi:hypothetical protein
VLCPAPVHAAGSSPAQPDVQAHRGWALFATCKAQQNHAEREPQFLPHAASVCVQSIHTPCSILSPCCCISFRDNCLIQIQLLNSIHRVDATQAPSWRTVQFKLTYCAKKGKFPSADEHNCEGHSHPPPMYCCSHAAHGMSPASQTAAKHSFIPACCSNHRFHTTTCIHAAQPEAMTPPIHT